MENTKLGGIGVKPIDYKNLLFKYMHHIGEQEGTCFTGTSLTWSTQFTEQEKEELRNLEKAEDETH